MRQFYCFVLLSLLVFPSFSQAKRVEGMRQFGAGMAANMNSFLFTSEYGTYMSKRTLLAVGLTVEKGDKGFTDLFTSNLCQNLNVNIFCIRLHEYLHINYYFSLSESAGGGIEYLWNSSLNKRVFNPIGLLGLGINNEIFFDHNYAIGVKIQQQASFNSKLGNNSSIRNYWTVIPEFKYYFSRPQKQLSKKANY